MKHAGIFYLILLPFLMIMNSCVTDDEPDNFRSLTVGDSLPNFTVVLNNGETVNPEILKGKVSLIVFFNTSCGDCRRELPEIQVVYEELKQDPEIKIFAISRAQENRSIEEYWKENHLTIPYSAQNDRKIYNLFAQSVIPRIYIADSQGIITAAFGDKDMPDAAGLIESIESALLSTKAN